MKTTKALTTVSSAYFHPEVDAILLKKGSELKERARRNAIHFASKNLPALQGDTLPPFVGDVKTGHEELAANVYQLLQPGTHYPEGKMQLSFKDKKEKELDAEIAKKETQNQNDGIFIPKYNPDDVPSRLFKTRMATAVIFAGEVVLNAPAFQIMGESLLLAFLLSISISFAIAALSHYTAQLCRNAESREKKIGIAVFSFVIASAISIALAYLRSKYLESQDTHIPPALFAVISIGLYSICTWISYINLPSKEEIQEHEEKFKIYNAIQKRKRETEELKKEKENLTATTMEKVTYHLKAPIYAESVADRIRKMYHETVAEFKTTNLIHRTDNGVPDCFRDMVPEPDINFFVFGSKNNNHKEHK